jgi:Tfp pilus assembly protein PilE
LIIAILATYSILAYIDSIYEAENKQAKSKLEVLNQGYERYLEEYPGSLLTSAQFTNASNTAACQNTDTTVSRLVACGYVPKLNFDGMKYSYFTRTTTGGCGSGYVYMRAKPNADVGSKYKDSYCAGINAKGYAIDSAI